MSNSFLTLWTIAHQGFSRQEYWSALPFPSPGDLPDPGIELVSPAWQRDTLPLSHRGSPKCLIVGHCCRYADDTTLMAESEELNSPLMKVKEESGKAGLKLNVQKTKIMASSPITSWQIDGETVETVADFILGGSKIIVDGDYSHEIKTLTPWKESYDQPR